jgi:hypothetical protein
MKIYPAVLDLFRRYIRTDGLSGHIRPFTGLRLPLARGYVGNVSKEKYLKNCINKIEAIRLNQFSRCDVYRMWYMSP